MNLHICGAVLVITSLACAAPGVPPPGQLAVIEPNCAPVANATSPGYHGLAVSDNQLFWNAGYRAYQADLSDPRRPQTIQLSGKSADNTCFVADFTEVDGVPYTTILLGSEVGGYVLVGDDLVPISGAGNYAIHRLSETHVALTQLSPAGGALEFLDVSDPSQPVTLSSFDYGEIAVALAAEGSLVFATTAFFDGAGEILTVDASDPMSTSVVSRAAIQVPWDDAYIATQRDQDIAVFTWDRSVAYRGQIRWYRLSADFKAAELRGAIDAVIDGPGGRPWGAAFTGEYLFIGIVSAGGYGRGTLVLRLDEDEGLVAHRHIAIPFPTSKDPTLVRVDEVRGLAFVSGTVIQILDLGVITDGVPRWP